MARWPGSSERAGRRRRALSKQRAARSRPQGLRSAGGHRASQGCEPSALGPQTLTRTYLLVAVVGDLLLDAVRELGAGILRIFPCSCAWKLSPEEKVTPFTGGFPTAAKITFFLPSASDFFPAPHARTASRPGRPTEEAGPTCHICRKAVPLCRKRRIPNAQASASKPALALTVQTCA